VALGKASRSGRLPIGRPTGNAVVERVIPMQKMKDARWSGSRTDLGEEPAIGPSKSCASMRAPTSTR
jgi:hypothetical protein